MIGNIDPIVTSGYKPRKTAMKCEHIVWLKFNVYLQQMQIRAEENSV
jgi:hypothetical protein